ncbi:ABC transporter substrate-binding protein [Treponema phagedenis]|uniref:ABC transporter substrate-binding protein n=1 Tax=Treponema phagedenis TaxID=162 RepID=UPI0011F04ACF|nr:ABC transporter substrate-binding protein [Treponema phagedenis]TYT77987.1 ABC transporter substrate-binding protein [Treponema phagedenis]
MKKILVGMLAAAALFGFITCGGGGSDSKGKLVWWTIGGTPKDLAPVLDEANNYVKDKLGGATFEMKYSDWGEFNEKMSKIINTGEPYDICFTCSWANPYIQNAKNGAFYPLDELLETEAKDLKAFIPDVLWDSAKVDGKIYAVPTYKDTAFAPYWAFNKDDLDALNLRAEDFEWKPNEESSLDSMRRLEKAFDAYKKANPNKYPLQLNKDGWAGMFDEFDMLTPPVGVAFSDKSGKIICPLETKVLQDKWDLLVEWNKKGYINPDAATLQENIKVLFLFGGHGFPYADVAYWSGNYPCKAVLRYKPYFTTGSAQGSMNAISAQSKNPKEALKLLELVNLDPKVRNLLAYGIEGKHYKKTGDTSIEFIDKKSYDVPAFSQGTFFTTYTVDPAPPQMWKAVQEFNQNVEGSPILGFSFDPTPIETELALVKAEWEKYDSFVRLGLKSRTEIYDEMMANLKAAGLDKIIAEAQKQLDAWKAAR